MADTYFQNKRIWITGASKGIGEALALELGQRGAQLFISGRDQAALTAIANQFKPNQVSCIPFDVTDKSANQQAAMTIESQFTALDIVILNAGTAEYVDVRQFDSNVFERQIQSNFLSMVYGVEAALPLLRKSNSAQLIGMSSTAAYGGLPRSEAYGASKAAIRNLFQALAISLAPEDISVSVICPGFVKTPLTDKNDFPMPMLISADKAARYIVDGIRKHQKEISFPKQFSITMKLITSLPSLLYTTLIRKMVLQQ